jgi:hypothetical protein
VRGRSTDRFDRRAGAIEPGFDDGADREVADRVDGKRPLAGRFQPIKLIAALLIHRDMSRALRTAHMAGDALMSMEDLDHPMGQPYLDAAADQVVRRSTLRRRRRREPSEERQGVDAPDQRRRAARAAQAGALGPIRAARWIRLAGVILGPRLVWPEVPEPGRA